MSDSTYRHLLLATDLTPEGQPVIERAKQLRDIFGARLTLLHILANLPTAVEYMPMSYSGDMILPKGFDLENELLTLARAQLDELGEILSVPPPDRLIKIGTTGYRIDATADELGVDLIVIGNRGRHGLRALFAPSTSKAVLRVQSCDVLCVPIGGRDDDQGS
ncbi:universal stress protein [Thioalkalicoccus limnaeus]|uniref:Universal stress protein n=1 Tax=Thioalkalicoccus limnaeus TaxID=120681 RepID=A0ABV4BK21_9GAMM